MASQSVENQPDPSSDWMPRRFLLRIGLQGKFIGLIVCWAVLVFGAMAIATRDTNVEQIMEQHRLEGDRALAAVLADASAIPLANLDVRQLTGIVAAARQRSGALYALVHGVDGVLLADAGRVPSPAIARDAFSKKLLETDEVLTQVTNGVLEIGRSVRHGGRRLGAVRMGVLPRPTQAYAAASRMRKVLFAIGFGLLGTILTLALMRSMTRPISKLIAGTRSVAEGTLDTRIDIRTHDELEVLAASFNQMSVNLQKMTETLQSNAISDPLTGLPNRTLFMDRLQHVAKRAARKSALAFAVIFLDVDRFKLLNDSFGHSAGDQLLADMGHRLKACLRDGDTIARLGGDEFGMLLEDLPAPHHAVAVAERIKRKLEQPFRLRGHEVFISASLGIAVAPPEGADPEALLRNADTAMYRAKNSGRGTHQVFDDQMRQEVLKTLQMQTSLRRALDRNELSLAYQPIVRLQTRAVAGFEALARWRYPHGPSVPPSDFIPVAEETGLIVPMGEWILREACRQLGRWLTVYPERVPSWMSVNLSWRQLAHADLIRYLDRLLRETKLQPSRLMVEITESVIMEDAEFAARTISALKAMGIQIAIDDFGTGYSSLSLLQRFPLDVVKIDRSFVGQVDTTTAEGTKVLRAIIDLASNLGLEVVAEGIELADQAALITELGCTYGQGYYFSYPLDGVSVAKLLIDGRTDMSGQGLTENDLLAASRSTGTEPSP